MKVSVITPIYNVAPFIERCTRSLMEQTLKEAEFIFIDDCATDNSIDILLQIIATYPKRQNQVKIVHHPYNKGLPAARNTGLKQAQGEYIFHCDSDDYIELDMLEAMYDQAKNKNADIVWSDYYLSFGQNERYMKQPKYNSPQEALYGMLTGAMKYNVWNKLIRKELYDGILFPEGCSMGEDMAMFRVMARAKSVTYIPKAYYHYIRINSGAMTQIYTECRLTELKINADDTIHYLTEHVHMEELDKAICLFKLNIKLPFLMSDRENDLLRWTNWYPEANRYIWSNENKSFRIKVLEWAASNRLFFINWLYYKFVYKIIYGKIYR